MNKIYYRNVVAALVMLVGTLGLQSCLKEQADVFDKSSSLREEEYMDKAQATLINAIPKATNHMADTLSR